MVSLRDLKHRVEALESGKPASATWTDPQVRALLTEFKDGWRQSALANFKAAMHAAEPETYSPVEDRKPYDYKRERRRFLAKLERISPHLVADFLEQEELDRPHIEQFANAIRLAAQEADPRDADADSC